MTSWTEILKANKGLHARDSFSELWGLKLKAARAEFPDYTITGTLPLTFNSRAAVALKNYRIHGTSEGAGVETENVYDLKLWEQAHPTYCQTVGDTVYITGVDASMISGAINVDVPSGYYFTVTPMAAQNGTTARQGRLRLIDENGTAHIYYITNVNNAPLPQISEQLSFAVKKIGVDYNTMNNGFGVKQMMFTPTAPTTFIPFGYKIPILNTSGETINAFELDKFVNGISMVRGTYTYDANNNIITIIATNNDAYTGNNNTYHISVKPNTKYVVSWTHSGDAGTVYAFENGITTTSSGYTHSAPTTLGRAFSFTTHSDVDYLVLRLGCTVESTSATYSNIMVTPTDTAPSEYIPHRYTSNYDLFLGDSKLGEEEYLDFVEQKMNKRTENLVPPTSEWISGFVDGRGQIHPAGNVTLEVTSPYIEIMPNVAYTYCDIEGFPYIENYTPWRAIAYYQEDFTFISRTADYLTTSISENAPSNAKYARMSFRTFGQEHNPMLVEGSTAPSSYIPYFQPTDPPAPFPTLATYKGENTLSSTETVGEVTVKGRISEVQNG